MSLFRKNPRRLKPAVRRSRVGRLMRSESLEDRRMLAGVVNIIVEPDATVAAGSLRLEGDGDNNQVQIVAGDEVGVYTIIGLEDTLVQLNGAGLTNPQQRINNITGDIVVALGDGADTFEFVGASGTFSPAPHDVLVINEGGGDYNLFDNVRIPGNLEVLSEDGGNTLEIRNESRVTGYTRVVNGTGTNTTKVDNSRLGGTPDDPALSVENGAGKDLLVISGNSQIGSDAFATAGRPALFVNNGDGASDTMIMGSSSVAGRGTTTIYGNVEIINGTNLPGFVDSLMISESNILGYLDVTNNDGGTVTDIFDSEIGSSRAELAPGNAAFFNGAGYDAFDATSSVFRWQLSIDNDISDSGESFRNRFGSATMLVDTQVNTEGGTLETGMAVYGDDGRDLVSLSGSSVRGWLDFFAYGGDDELTLAAGSTSGPSQVNRLYFDGREGNDNVTISDSAVLDEVYADFGDDDDAFTISGVDPSTQWPSPLLGFVYIDGGLGADTLSVDPFSVSALDFEFFTGSSS